MVACVNSTAENGERLGDAVVLDPVRAGRFAELALANLVREYPNKPCEVLTADGDLRVPRDLHPVFYGCFDWHSAVHGHWMLVRLVRMFPGMAVAAAVRERLALQFRAAGLAVEAAYFAAAHNRGFERMYGWAWALRLAAELRTWRDEAAGTWAANLAPLERVLVQLAMDYLPRLSHPIRTGVHPDTGFALAQMLDYARAVGDGAFERMLVERAVAYFGADTAYPAGYEPSGEDFFSSGLNEADLMRRVLPAERFSHWLDGFLPGLADGLPARWAAPAVVPDLTDGRLVHLVGLNLSRAWTLRGVASALPAGDARRGHCEAAALRHEVAGLRDVFSGSYEGEHWLATFAVYHLSRCGLAAQD